MRPFILGILILFTIRSFSQKKDFRVVNNEIILGINYLDSSEIKGQEYIFPERIHETYLDTTTGFLTVQLRGTSKNGKWLKNSGQVMVYDLNNKGLKWSKKIGYLSSSLQQFSHTIIYSEINKSYCLDINTGNALWKVKNNIYYVDAVANIGIGYKYKNSTGYTNNLEGINLENGNVIWKKELNREYSWNNVLHANDSTLIIVAAGLHSINIKNGIGWDYNTVTGKKDYTATAGANVAGVALGILTGTFIMSTGHNLVRDVVSNVIVDSSIIYFSSAEQLAKINKETGEVIWNHPFPKKQASKSTIFTTATHIYMINNGYAFMGNRQLNFGKPFISAFEKESGKQEYLSLIDTDPILGFKIMDEEIYLVFKNRIAKYSQVTGKLMLEKNFDNESFGELKYFVGNHVFITNENNEFISLPQSDTSKVYVFTSKGMSLSIDNQLNISKIINNEDLNIYYLQTEDYKFIAKDKFTWVIDNDGQKVAEINMTSKAFLIGETLYEKQNDKFITLNISNICSN